MPQPIDHGAMSAQEVLAQGGDTYVASLYGQGWTEGEIFQRVESWWRLLSLDDIETVMVAGMENYTNFHETMDETVAYPTDIRDIRYVPGSKARSITVTGHVTVIDKAGKVGGEGDFTCTIFAPVDWTEVDQCATAFAEYLMSLIESPEPDHWYWNFVSITRGFFIEYR
jgi:hypothetical protein